MQNKSINNQFPINSAFYSEGMIISPESGELLNGEKNIRISPNNMRVLVTLLKQPQQVVSRTELFDSVWKNQIVSDDTLTRCISDLRNALKICGADKKLIETIPKLGYRWLAQVDRKNKLVGKSEVENEDVQRTLKPADLSYLQSTKQVYSLISRQNWWPLILLTLVIFLATLVWQTSEVFDRQLVRIALMPMQSKDTDLDEFKRNVEEKIKESLLNTDKIRFLSSQALDNKRAGLYPYLSREYAIDWIIEGDISIEGTNSKVTINIVDARTALVEYSFSEVSLLKNSKDAEQVVDTLIANLKRSILIE